MGDLTRGLYETLLTELLAERLGQATLTGEPDLVELRNAEAADRIALHLARVIRQAIELGPDEDRGERGAELARKVIEQLTGAVGDQTLLGERPMAPAQTLRSIRGRLPDGSPETIDSPLIPLLDTTLL